MLTRAVRLAASAGETPARRIVYRTLKRIDGRGAAALVVVVAGRELAEREVVRVVAVVDDATATARGVSLLVNSAALTPTEPPAAAAMTAVASSLITRS